VKNIDVDLEMDCSSRNDKIFTEQYDDSDDETFFKLLES
jgi:hypothetical protein